MVVMSSAEDEMADFERYEHSVLEVSQQLVGFISGTFCGLSQDQMFVRAAWLDWRIADAQWRPSRFGVGEEHEYEAIARDLARAALRCFRANCEHGGVSTMRAVK